MNRRDLRRVFRIPRGIRGVERDVDAELAFHIEMRERRLIAKGLSPDAAHAAALSQFGDYNGVRAECLTINRERERAMKFSELWSNFRQDVRYAIRSLIEHGAFSVVVLLTLALGIGANTATFTVIDALMLRTLPVPHPEQLVTVGDPSATGSLAQGTPLANLYSYPIYADVRDHNDVFSGLYAMGSAGALDVFAADSASTGGIPEHPAGRFVTGNYFDVLQVHALAGRTFTAADDRSPGSSPFVVISHGYWQRRFGGDRSAIGRTLSINGTLLTIIGVMPETFSGDVVGSRTDLWLPMMMQPMINANQSRLRDRKVSWLLIMGRLAPEKTLAQAQQRIPPLVARSIRSDMSDSNWTEFEKKLHAHPVPVGAGGRGFSSFRSAFGQALVILMAAVAVVLLVVCANIANLMLARAAARAREISVRLALGASRARLIQQLLTESMLLAAVSAAVGLVVAVIGTRALLKIAAQGPRPIPLDVHVDARVLAYTSLVTLLTAVLFGLMPALRATRVEVVSALRTQGRGGSGALRGRGRLPMAKVLVVAQVALSVLLLVATGVLLRSMQRIASADLGVARDHLLLVSVDAQHRGYVGPRLSALITDLTQRAQSVPGVAAVSYSVNGIFTGTESMTSIRVPGYQMRADSDKVVTFDAVGAGYFRAVGTPMLRGRDIASIDDERSARVVVVNETMARYYFPNGDAVGRTITRRDSTYTIVGVAHDVEEQDVRAAPIRRAYFAVRQLPDPPSVVYLAVRSAGDPAALVKPIESALAAADAALPVTASPLNSLVHDSLGQMILITQVISFFGAFTLLLAALGLYGVMAFTTARRTSEFGLRMALGASPSAVTGLVLREALALVALGLAVGIPAGIGAARLIRSQLFGVGAFDPLTTTLSALVLALVAVVSAGLPALRAARVAPVEALSAD